jgi:hypothetical protein
MTAVARMKRNEIREYRGRLERPRISLSLNAGYA